MLRMFSTKNPPDVVFYQKLKLPKVFENSSGFVKKLKADVSFQAQGDAVELDEGSDIEILMVALDVVRKVSPEAVLVLHSGEKILLFDHQTKDVLRREDINTDYVSKEVIKKGTSKRILRIYIESAWNEVSKNGGGYNLRSSLERIRKKITNTQVTTLVGKQPKALLLLTQHLVYPFSKEIRYQEDGESQPLIIYK